MHAEAPYRTSRVNNDEDVKNIFAFLKDLNANFVRLCHYPHDERMERAADRDGIMVWSEIPIWQRISYDKPEVYEKAKRHAERDDSARPQQGLSHYVVGLERDLPTIPLARSSSPILRTKLAISIPPAPSPQRSSARTLRAIRWCRMIL